MANKPRNSQLKLCQNPKFPVADKEQDQPNFSPTRKFPLADKGRDSQPKLSSTPKFPVAYKTLDFQKSI